MRHQRQTPHWRLLVDPWEGESTEKPPPELIRLQRMLRNDAFRIQQELESFLVRQDALLTTQAAAANAQGKPELAAHFLSQIDYNRTLLMYLASDRNHKRR